MTIEVIVIADAPPIDGAGELPDHPTLAEKEMYRDVADTLTVGSVGMGLTGSLIGLAGPELWGPAAYALVLSAGMALGAVGFNRLANDPPDPDYEEAVRVELLSMRPPGTSAGHITRMCDRFSRLLPFTSALLTSYERAQGATAAGDPLWSRGHLDGVALLRDNVATEILKLADGIEDRRPPEVIGTALHEADYPPVLAAAASHQLLPSRVRDLYVDGG